MLGASAVRRDEVATLSNFHLVIAGIAVVVALAVISASLRMTERAIGHAVEQREAATRFFANELSGLPLQ